MLSKNLNILLEAHNEKLSVRELAKRIGIPFSTLQRIVSGKVFRTNKKAIKAIADYFSISIEELTNKELTRVLPKSIKENFSIDSIPIIDWNEALEWKIHIANPMKKTIFYEKPNNEALFALKVENEVDMLFPKGSLLIFDPYLEYTDRSYVLVFLASEKITTFSKILIEDGKVFLVRKESNSHKLIELKIPKDKIIATMIEARITFNEKN